MLTEFIKKHTLAVWAAGTLFGPSGFLGISTLALIACLTSSNSSLYIALCSNYGDARWANHYSTAGGNID
ncbi:hypothetical protein KAM622c_31640 [Klebsiella quasipneumoniae subsp. quasipneumoniae]|nr:hypothetical protein KAM622c_31640 [Klebsiella quasipneumoniae subsp. quasipneumoniae]